MKYLDQLKKVFVLMVAAICTSIVYIGPSTAQTYSEWYLQQIANNTYNMLQIMQNSGNLAGFAVSWLQQDTGDDSVTTKAQQGLAMSGWMFTISQALIKAQQRQIVADIMDRPLADFEGKNPIILADVPNVNEISFSSLVGAPPVANKPVDLYGYVKNAAAVNSLRPVPDSSWEGDDDSKERYKNYYDTVTSIESFDAYVISQLATDSLLKVDENRNQLLAFATSSDFFSKIATEELGRVLRQILLFTSQTFVVNAELQKNLKEMVAAQAMTNTMLIKLNELNEFNLAKNAKGKDPSSKIN